MSFFSLNVISKSTKYLRNSTVFRKKLISPNNQQIRLLNLHEHQSIDIMKSFGVNCPKGIVATTADDAEKAFRVLRNGKDRDVVIKAQALTGGRGLGHFKNGFHGGVHICTREGEAHDFAEKMLNQSLVTKQTGPRGIEVSKVFLMERLYLRREMYFSILMDRKSQGPLIVASPSGGTSIEDVAANTPELIYTVPIDIMDGPQNSDLVRLCKRLGIAADAIPDAVELMNNLYKMFIKTDATLVEINPLAETPDGGIFACDAKINFDDNAEFRQKEIHSKRDTSQEDPREVEASAYNLNYIGLSGNIGCLVNGAGLAMATMDIIKLYGGTPANFLDVGGGANEAQVKKAFELLNADRHTKSILVNIFGGIMRCDVIAAGIIAAVKEIGLKKPLIVRLQGTNVDKAKALIENSGFRIIVTDNLDLAAKNSVKIANIVTQAEEMRINVAFQLPL